MFEQTTLSLIEFIKKSPTSFHAISSIKQMLLESGFRQLSENDPWALSPGDNGFVIRSDSSLIAFRIPEKNADHFQIIASHSDSPSFKIKENAEIMVDGHYTELNVEKYGGMLMAPWFDRPLSVAGRIVVRTEHGLESRLVDVDRDLLVIPNLAIHMNRQVNEGYTYHPQKDMMPLFGDETAGKAFLPLIAETAGVKKEEILGTDLFLYNRVPGTIWGASREFFSSPRLDNLQSVYSSVRAFLDIPDPESISVCCVFDAEEVGSTAKQGADSTFLEDTLTRICLDVFGSAERYPMMIAGSFMLSADNAHAVHPHHTDKADPTNRPYMNHGPVLKFNACQKYTTDSVSGAVFKEICRRADVPRQIYINHSDIPGGSTLGNIANRHVSLPTADIGCAQLAMHSPYETAGTKDTWYMLQAMKMFYQTRIQVKGSQVLLQ